LRGWLPDAPSKPSELEVETALEHVHGTFVRRCCGGRGRQLTSFANIAQFVDVAAEAVESAKDILDEMK